MRLLPPPPPPVSALRCDGARAANAPISPDDSLLRARILHSPSQPRAGGRRADSLDLAHSAAAEAAAEAAVAEGLVDEVVAAARAAAAAGLGAAGAEEHGPTCKAAAKACRHATHALAAQPESPRCPPALPDA